MTDTSAISQTTGEQRWDARLWGTLFVLCGALFLDSLDLSMVGVALPPIQQSLHMTTSALQWVVSAYILGYGGLLLLGGRTADLLGRRKVFLVAIAVFMVASLVGGLVNDGTLLIVTRFLKGISAAFTAPAGMSIITTTFREGRSRTKAMSIYTTCSGVGFSLGLVLGGTLTEIGWRWTFFLPVPIALAVLVAGAALIVRDQAQRRSGHSYDLAGAITSTGGLLLLVYAVVSAGDVGWGSVQTIGELVVAAALLVGFVLIELRSRNPLIRLAILRSGMLVRANLGAVAMFGAYASYQFLLTLYLQEYLHWSPLATAMAFLPAGVITAVVAPRTVGLDFRYGTSVVAALGFGLWVVGYVLLLRSGDAPNYFAEIMPTVMLLGLGFAFGFPALNIQATTGVADEEQGLASGLVNTSFQVGGAIILAIVTAVVTSGGLAAHPGSPQSLHLGLLVVIVVAAIGIVVALSGVRRRAATRPVPSPDPELVSD
jgi:MFS family permease